MGKISKLGGLIAALSVALTLGAVSLSAAAGTDVVWKKSQVLWASYGAGVAATGDSVRWQHLTDENDSTRTQFISTQDWAWDVSLGGTTGNGVTNIATLECACLTNNLAVGNDSIHVMVEKRAPNGKVNYNATMVAGVGTVLSLQGAGSATSAVFRGALVWDPDAQETVNMLTPGTEFRLVLKGDQGSTTPALGRCGLWITYPSRRASQ